MPAARLRAERDQKDGYLSDVRHGSVYRNNDLLMNEQTRDRAFALIVHSDEIDTAANKLGSRSGRSLLVASIAVGNADKGRLFSPNNCHTFLVASKEAVKSLGYARIFSHFLEEIKQLRQGMYIYT